MLSIIFFIKYLGNLTAAYSAVSGENYTGLGAKIEFVWCAWNYLYDEKLAKKTSIVINEKWITKEELIESADLYDESPYKKHSTYISVKKEDNKQYCCRLVTAYVIVFMKGIIYDTIT